MARSQKPLTDENKQAMLEFMKAHYSDGPPMSKDQMLCFWESYFGFCRDSGSGVAKLFENFGGDRVGDIDSVIPRHRMTVTPASQYFQALRGEGFSIVFDYQEQ